MTAIFDAPIHTNAQNLERVLAAGKPALLVFEAPGCGPCGDLAPALDTLAREFAGRVLIVRLDNAGEGNLVARYHLTRLPTLVVWRAGREAARAEGALPLETLRAYLNFAAGAGAQPAPASGPAVSLSGAPAPQPAAATNGGAGVIAVTDSQFESEILRAQLPTVVDFWAPWCGPCRMVSPIVEELGREYAGRLRVAKMNTDENPEWASRLGIQGIPTLIFFKNGREVERVVGAAPKARIKSTFEKVLGK